MKQYMLLFRGGDGKFLQESPEKWQAHMQKWIKWTAELTHSGKFMGSQPLNETGKVVIGKKFVRDGPFGEGKDMVGGYLMCRADDYDEAVVLSKGCPILEFEDGVVEVREIKTFML